jgi:hypothetical protein
MLTLVNETKTGQFTVLNWRIFHIPHMKIVNIDLSDYWSTRVDQVNWHAVRNVILFSFVQ